MAAYDFSAPRLFVAADLGPDVAIPLDRAQANYLLNVLRLRPGERVLLFNGRHGEWSAAVAPEGRKAASLLVGERTREQPAPSRLTYLFAPLKAARLDYMAQKAVEMGAGRLQPVFTRRTQASRINLERLRANAVEAAEQCGILAVPEILPEADLPGALAGLPEGCRLVFCDEEAPPGDALATLLESGSAADLAVLIGPEGGFDEAERALLGAHPGIVRISLGPRILRADTAAVAALALVQAAIGDWRT